MSHLKSSIVLVLILVTVCSLALAAPETVANKNKSEFGHPFDEIVVESSLIVRRKDPSRQGRTMPQISTVSASKIIVPEEGKPRPKRFAGIPVVIFQR